MSSAVIPGIPQAAAARSATVSNDVSVADADDAGTAVDERFSTALDAATPVIEDALDEQRPEDPPPAAAVLSSPAAEPAAANAGWPPPGLSSLFPAALLFAAPPAAPSTPPTLAAPAAAKGTWLPPAPRPVLDAGPVALPPDALGPLAPLASLASGPAPLLAVVPPASAPGMAPAATANPLPTALALATPIAPPTVAGPAAAMVSVDPIAAALARQPGVLRLPNTEERIAVLESLVGPADSAAVTTAFDALAPLALPTAVTPKLDLAQAFPTPVPLPSPRFADELAARVQWIAEQKGGEATLRIAPEGLGPVEIRLKLDGERVDLGFSASQQETRQALEQALPKLREMLSQQGLQLGNADVGHRHAGHTQDGDSRRSGSRADGLDDDSALDARLIDAGPRTGSTLIGRGGLGVLDLYA